MNPPLLPPQNLWLSLPALSADEAEMMVHLVDELQRLLWDAYGDAIIDQHPTSVRTQPPCSDPSGTDL